jgi:hypothetical protein
MYFRASSHHFLCLDQMFLAWGPDFMVWLKLAAEINPRDNIVVLMVFILSFCK